MLDLSTNLPFEDMPTKSEATNPWTVEKSWLGTEAFPLFFHLLDTHFLSAWSSGRCSKRKENECQGDGRKVGKLQFPATTFRQSRGSLPLISSAYLQKVSLSINPACWQTSKRTPTPTSWRKTKN